MDKLIQLVQSWNKGEEDPQLKGLIQAEVVPDFSTIRLVSNQGRVPSGAKARVLLLHGIGAFASHSKTMSYMISLLSTASKGKPGSSLKYIQEFPTYQLLAAEAIDLPGHGVGPSLDQFQILDDVIEWIATYIRQMKAETPELPLYVIARSASPAFMTGVYQKYPDLIDAMVFISPECPGREDLVPLQRQAVLQTLEAENVTFNDEGYTWYKKLTSDVVWDKKSFQSLPLLILLGTQGYDFIEAEREYYKFLNKECDNIHVIQIPGAKHNVFETRRPFKPIGRIAYNLFYDFLKQR